MAEVVSKDIAQAEIEKWLDYKKIRQTKRDANKENIDSLISAMNEGILILNPDMSFTQKLSFAITDKEGKSALSQLEYKPRINISLLHLHLQGVKRDDADGRLVAHITALTSQAKELIKKLDTEDYSVAMSIAVFFV